jgi:hypothetical protein
VYNLQNYKKLIWLIAGPAEVVASPRPCDLILQLRKPVVFLLPSSVNYRHKAFSGLSSCTINVLPSRLLLESLAILVSNKNDNIVQVGFHAFSEKFTFNHMPLIMRRQKFVFHQLSDHGLDSQILKR